MPTDVRTWAQVVAGDTILGGWTVTRRVGRTVHLAASDGATKRGEPRADAAVTVVERGPLGRVIDMFSRAGLAPDLIREM